MPTSRTSTNCQADQAGRRITLLGTINDTPALLTAERAAFPSDSKTINAFHVAVTNVKNLGANDIYHWYLASSGHAEADLPDLKLNLIYPCTEKHIKKYSPQDVRMVTETPKIYKEQVRPYMQKQRDEGRLNWVFNIIEGRTEQEDVMLRDHGESGQDGFLLLPDLNWDRKTLKSLHLLGLVERRDIWSLRDLKKENVPWLKNMREKILDATVGLYPDVERDMLKLYIHCGSTPFKFCPIPQIKLYKISPPTTISTSMSSIACSNRAIPKRPAKPSVSRTSFPSSKLSPAVPRPVWPTST